MEPLRSEVEPYPSDIHELERWASLAAATAVIAYGFTRRSAPGVALAVAAAPLVYRGMVGKWPFENGHSNGTRTALAGARGIHVRESVRLERPVSEVYAIWRQLENLPRVLSHLEQVEEFGDGRSHWVARGPADLGVEWDAEIINEVEPERIGWRTLQGAAVEHAGSVEFEPIGEGASTRVTVTLQYDPPAGPIGAALATLLGQDPGHTIADDLHRLKQAMEAEAHTAEKS